MTIAHAAYIPAPEPPDEHRRLDALHGFGLLDSDPEEDFDRLVILAARLFKAPIALVSLVDADRQFLMARCGLETRETSRDVAFCAHAILDDDILEVPDATSDPRFAGNPLVVGPPHVRYYAGKPLIDGSGNRLGTLCIIDMAPRAPLDPEQRAILTDLAGVVMSMIEIRVRALDAESERQRAQRLAELKDDYLGAMAHELRTPVNAMAGFGQLLKITGAEAALTEQQRDYLNAIVESGEYLNLLITETLQAQALQYHDGGGPCLDGVALAPLVAAVLRLIAPLADKQGVTLEADIPDAVKVWADALRLRQVLINLVSNAVKYNRKGGRVRLEARETDGDVSIACIDTGKGIPEQDLPRLFRAFQRIESTSEGVEGTGLGLRITKRLVMMMGGRIQVSSQFGKGSTFTVILPAADETDRAGGLDARA